MCQATSKKIVVTATGRGTQGYRAPEVLSDSVTGFNNKADIWAVGCILYELMTGNKLFTNDFHVREYQFSDMAVKISVRDVPHVLQLHLSEIVTELLHRDYQQRPSAKQLLWVFHAYLIIVRLSIIERRDLAKSLPSHREWTGLINGCQNLNQLNARLLEYFKSRRDYNAACFLCTSLILRRSPSEELAQQMAELYKLRDNNEQAIADCRSLIEHFPSNASLLGHLTTFCQLKGGNSLAGKVWKELVDSQPTNALWKTARDEVIVETCITKGDWESAIVALKRLVTKNSNQPSYMVELEAAFRACHMSAEDRIAVWAEFVDQNPRAGVLQDQLWKACYQLNHPDLVVNQWEKLVEAHPKEMTLYDRLSSACKLPGSSRDPVRVWEGLVERNPGPSGYLFSFPLDQALLESGDIRQAILVCRRRIMKVPLEPDIEQLKKALGQVTVDEAFVVWNELLTQYPRHMTIKSCFELAYIKTRRGC
jgi:tetratricopeptide (TPR) repeat protein